MEEKPGEEEQKTEFANQEPLDAPAEKETPDDDKKKDETQDSMSIFDLPNCLISIPLKKTINCMRKKF